MQEYDPQQRIRQIVTITIILIVGGVIAWLVYLRLTTATIVFSTAESAEIFTKQGQGDFQSLGKGKATLKTRDTDLVIAESRLDGQVTQRSVQPERRKSQKVSLDLRPLIKADRLASGPLTSMFLDGRYIYGINPNTGSLSASIVNAGPNDIGPPLPLLPRLLQITWSDVNNYFFATTKRSGGMVINGTPQLEEGALPYYEAADTDSGVLGLLANDGFYIAKNLPGVPAARKIVDITPGTSPAIFSDADKIFLVELVYGGSDNDQEATASGTNLQVFSESGDSQGKFELPIKSRSFALAGIKNKVVVLSEDNVTLLDTKTGDSRPLSFSFGEVEDMVLSKGRIILLGSSGLWELNPDNAEYQKVAVFPEGEVYVRNSLEDIDGSLYFSTSTSRSELTRTTNISAQSSIYKITLP